MKLSFLIANLGVRGSIRRIVELSNRMVSRGHDVKIFHSDGSPCAWLPCVAKTLPEAELLEHDHDCLIYFGDVPHFELVKQANAKLRSLYVLGLNENDPDLIPVLTTNVPTDARTRSIREALFYPGLLVLTNCSALNDFLLSIGVDCRPVIGGVNFDVFYPRPMERKPMMVLAGGAKRDIEGTAVILEAIEMLKKTVPEVSIEFYAKRGYSQEYLAELYSTATVFFDAQRHGGWNNPVAEAMACGCPVVCSDIWGNRDFAINKQTAMVTSDPARMARAIHRLLTDKDLRYRMAYRANTKIRPFTWERATDQLEAVLRERL